MRQKWIDNAKGIAMLFVIIGHVSNGLQGPFNFQFVYGFHLVMFFLLSGYTFKKKDLDKKYINDKFSRLMVPYFFTCLAIIITDIINSNYLNNDNSLSTITSIIYNDLLRSFFASGTYTNFGTIELGTRIGAIWFLPAMFFATLIFQFLLHTVNPPFQLGFCTASIAIIGSISARFIWLPFSIQSSMLAVFFLWLGYEIKRNGILGYIKWYHYIIALLTFLFGIYYNYCNVAFVIAWSSDIILGNIVGLSGCLLVYFVSIHLKSSKIISYIGKNSMLVLCTHLYALETMWTQFNRILDKTNLQGNFRIWLLIAIEILFAVILAFLIDIVLKKTTEIRHKILKHEQQRRNISNSKRDVSIDVLKGIIILSTLISLFPINNMLKSIIYSYNMVSFVVLSGYFYKKRDNLLQTLLHLIKTLLIPYVLLCISILLMNYEDLSPDIISVFPMYFIFVLFVIRILYTILDKFIKSKYFKLFILVFLSFTGMQLGHSGHWLPLSIDISLYALIYYQIGIYCKEYDLLTKFKENHITYFIFTPIWVYMIYSGSMNFAERNYGKYGLVIIGSAAGILIIYKLAVYIVNELPILTIFLNIIGKSSLFITIIYTLFNDYICRFVSSLYDEQDTLHMIFSILLQLLLAISIEKGLTYIKSIIRKYCIK